MEKQEILRQLERYTGSFPRAAVEAAVMQREGITPELLRVLRETTARAAELEDDEDHMAHLYAMYLLAQFREVQAYPLVVEFASLPGKLLDSLCGDFIADDLGRVLASVCGGDLSGIQSLIENEAVDEWVRVSAVSGLVALVAAGQKCREEIVDYFGQLFRGRLERRYAPVWARLVSGSADLYPAELMEDIEQAYRDDLVDSGWVGLEEIKKELAHGKDWALARLAERHHRPLVDDTIEEMEDWACFHADEDAEEGIADPLAGELPFPHTPAPRPPGIRLDEGRATEPPPPPFRRDQPKTGRNDPCPCGSGKKFKKCCGA